jgi:integrase
MRRLLAATPKRYRPLFALCLFSGLRLSEALGLVWADVDFDHAMIRVRFQRSRDGKRARMKTPGAVRDVVLMDELAHLLRKAKMASHFKRPQDPVFATGNRTSLSQRNATRAFEKSLERATLSDVSFHSLRHTFASLLIAQGRDPVFVADQLGHTSPKTTLGVHSHLFRAAREALAARSARRGVRGAAAGGVKRGASNCRR